VSPPHWRPPKLRGRRDASEITISADWFIDATQTGELLPLCGGRPGENRRLPTQWLESPNGYLDGARPIDVLVTRG
jgi:hypothetical protein